MSRGGFRSVKWGAVSLATLLAVAALSTDPAEARRRHRAAKPAHAAKVERYQPAYASIVVDANSGAVLEATAADAPRHPASLTKIMTLYLLFERLEAGKIKLTSELPISAQASMQAPSKLNLKPGQTISVENAIRAVVTKSANDVAVAIGEALAGSEENFGREMTAKARALGMKHTLYRNASGLPNDEQITTARDQALLGRAIQERFPKYYKYFSTRTFTFAGKSMRNHNKLLGAVNGVDGIKTGYINASGFNLVTSVNRAGRHIVAVVFGGRTANARDARMRELIEKHIKVASLRKDTTAMADAGPAVEPPASKPQSASGRALVRTAAALETRTDAPALGSTDPIKPVAVKTVAVKMASLPAAAADPTHKLSPPSTGTAKVTTIAVKADKGAKEGVLGTLVVSGPKLASIGDSVPVAAKSRGGYTIQVGAFDEEAEAKNRLTAAINAARDVLADADPFTEKAAKGDKTIYRARFAGLDKEQAETACKHLQRGQIPCMMLKN
ncbi:MAG: D-alanyl-D-alanine carboxypeptidase [Pseudolabrys sp.]|nr:D-alanyl-D-alanine carboxypeptidase [Pseudolabrys sp.]